MKTIMQFNKAKQSTEISTAVEEGTKDMSGLLNTVPATIVDKMRRDLYAIPSNIDVDKIKDNQVVNFADRTAMHIKNGLTEI